MHWLATTLDYSTMLLLHVREGVLHLSLSCVVDFKNGRYQLTARESGTSFPRETVS